MGGKEPSQMTGYVSGMKQTSVTTITETWIWLQNTRQKSDWKVQGFLPKMQSHSKVPNNVRRPPLLTGPSDMRRFPPETLSESPGVF